MYIERGDWGARAGKSGPGALIPSRVEGIALHWPALGSPVHGVESVKRALRSWQAMHIDERGWADIAYQEAIDVDGNVYGLRGLRTQSAANGDQDVNARFGALLLVLAPHEDVPRAMVAAVQDRVAKHRELFSRSRRIVGHGDIRPEPTECPGGAIRDLIASGAFVPGTDDEPEPNRVQRARVLLERGVDVLGAIPKGKRPEVAQQIDVIRRALAAMPES